MPRLEAGIMDRETFMGITAVRGSFFLPFLCFVVVAAYALFTVRQHRRQKRVQ
jgi:fucose permease